MPKRAQDKSMKTEKRYNRAGVRKTQAHPRAVPNHYYFFRPPSVTLSTNIALKSMTATASNRSQRYGGKRPDFCFGGLLTSAELK